MFLCQGEGSVCVVGTCARGLNGQVISGIRALGIEIERVC